MEKKWFPLARKSVSTSKNKVIFQKLNFRYGFHQQKKSPNKKNTVSGKQKIDFHQHEC